jgi:hypothetical protein
MPRIGSFQSRDLFAFAVKSLNLRQPHASCVAEPQGVKSLWRPKAAGGRSGQKKSLVAFFGRQGKADVPWRNPEKRDGGKGQSLFPPSISQYTVL